MSTWATSLVLTACKLRGLRRLREDEFRRNPGFAHLVEPDLVDARILIFVFDLIAAQFDAGLAGRFRAADAARAALLLGEDVAHAAQTRRQVARCVVGGDEVLVELLRARREHRAELPVDALE